MKGIGAVSQNSYVFSPVEKAITDSAVADAAAFIFFQFFQRESVPLGPGGQDQGFAVVSMVCCLDSIITVIFYSQKFFFYDRNLERFQLLEPVLV